jgi:hypothetical protein
MSFYGGLLVMIAFVSFALIIIPDSNFKDFTREDSLKEICSSFYTFRFLLMLVFTVFSTGVVIRILRKYKVNYLFIFELDPHYKVTQMQLFRVSLMLFSIIGFCFMG